MLNLTAGFLSLVLADVNSNLTPSSAALAFVAGEVIVFVSPAVRHWVTTYRTPLMIGAGATMAVHYFGAFSQAASLGVGVAVGILALYATGKTGDRDSTSPLIGGGGINRFNSDDRHQSAKNTSRMSRQPGFWPGSGMPGPLYLGI